MNLKFKHTIVFNITLKKCLFYTLLSMVISILYNYFQLCKLCFKAHVLSKINKSNLHN
jgi:hypothetical protein